MIEKSLFIIVVIYCVSFSLIIGQYIFGDVYGITLRAYDGTPIRSPLLNIIDMDNLNAITSNIVNANATQSGILQGIELAFQVGYYVAWELLLILTGTYIFNFLALMGVPGIVIGPLIILYVLLLGRAIVGYIRGL